MFNELTGYGNRMSVPSACCISPGRPAEHFVYRTTASLPVSDAELDMLAEAVTANVRAEGIEPCEIKLILGQHLSPEAKAVFDRVKSVHPDLSILACEWVALHEDSSYAGSAFVSRVLKVGPSPYVLNLSHTQLGAGRTRGLRVRTSSLVLEKGDTFVFDPTTPHMAMPVYLNDGGILVLLQWEEPDASPEERESLLRKYPVLPPRPRDAYAWGYHLLASSS
jgi:hypothetical protein